MSGEIVSGGGRHRTINPDLQRWYATRAHSRKVEVAGASRSVYVSRPKEVAALIKKAASGARYKSDGLLKEVVMALSKGRGIIDIPSNHSVDETVEKLKTISNPGESLCSR